MCVRLPTAAVRTCGVVWNFACVNGVEEGKRALKSKEAFVGHPRVVFREGDPARMQRAAFSFRIFLLLLPVIMIFIVRWSSRFDSEQRGRRWWMGAFPRRREQSVEISPWAVAVVLVVLLVLLTYQPWFRSKWFGPLCRSY
ncbi:hypothetical protein Droror1_Dr00010258 [Drosera rotundifolia]